MYIALRVTLTRSVAADYRSELAPHRVFAYGSAAEADGTAEDSVA